MKIWALISIMVIFSLCISESPETTPPETTPLLTTQPSTTTPETTLPPIITTPATTPASVNEEKNYCAEKEIPENLDNLQLYEDVHAENPSITVHKPYFFCSS